IVLAAALFCRKRKVSFWQLADLVVPVIPAGYFFGRIGNFLNGELFGRPTDGWWGMYFPSDSLGLLRHPSQIYEAFWEGAVLFGLLWAIRNQARWQGELLWLYFIGYGLVRFAIEFVREPDSQLGLFWGWLTLGQIFSLVAVLVGIGGILWKKRNIQEIG
ncbi:prolipoprotein diacylglyceryl transferase, partial [Patescibacteria group bacterium]